MEERFSAPVQTGPGGTPSLLTMSRARAEPDGTGAETTFRLSLKRTSPFKSAGESVQSTAGSRGVRINVTNAGYTALRGRVRVLATHSIRQFPLHFPSRASPCAITFRMQYTYVIRLVSFNERIHKFQLREFLNSTEFHNGTRFNFLFLLQILIFHSFCFKVIQQHCFFFIFRMII